jgi:hypothetical protein
VRQRRFRVALLGEREASAPRHDQLLIQAAHRAVDLPEIDLTIGGLLVTEVEDQGDGPADPQ